MSDPWRRREVMPVDFVFPIVVILAFSTLVVGLTEAVGKRRRRVFALLLLFEFVLATFFWTAYFLPGIMLRRDAEGGNSFAQYRLAQYYHSRLGYLWPDLKAAKLWMMKAAENGDANAMLEVGSAYSVSDNWLGIQPDSEKAIFWLTKASNKGDPTAAQLLEQLPKSDPTSLLGEPFWYTKSDQQ